MSRYIDADALEKGMQTWEWQELYLPIHFKQLIDEQPTADVRENVRGEWHLMESVWDDNTWQCSVCGEPFVLITGEPDQNGYNFCPNCGADMRKEVK